MGSVVDVKNAVVEVTSETGKVRLLNGGMCAIPTPPFQIPLVGNFIPSHLRTSTKSTIDRWFDLGVESLRIALGKSYTPSLTGECINPFIMVEIPLARTSLIFLDFPTTQLLLSFDTTPYV